MCMMELATKTMMADSRIGSQSALRGTMRSLLRLRGRMQYFPRERLRLPGAAVKSADHVVITGRASAQSWARSVECARGCHRGARSSTQALSFRDSSALGLRPDRHEVRRGYSKLSHNAKCEG